MAVILESRPVLIYPTLISNLKLNPNLRLYNIERSMLISKANRGVALKTFISPAMDLDLPKKLLLKAASHRYNVRF